MARLPMRTRHCQKTAQTQPDQFHQHQPRGCAADKPLVCPRPCVLNSVVWYIAGIVASLNRLLAAYAPVSIKRQQVETPFTYLFGNISCYQTHYPTLPAYRPRYKHAACLLSHSEFTMISGFLSGYLLNAKHLDPWRPHPQSQGR